MGKEYTYICKGIALLMMYFHHLFYSYESFEGYGINFFPLTGEIVIHIAWICKACVAIFVFLTGYGYAKGNSEDNYVKNTIRRYFKLMFGFWFIYILAIITSFLGRTPVEVYGKDMKSIFYALLDFMGMAFFTETPTYNATWWYMSLAVLFILITPLILKMCNKTSVDL